MDVLKWAREHNCDFNLSATISRAANEEVRQWVMENCCDN
jgi:hypothetical protein